MRAHDKKIFQLVQKGLQWKATLPQFLLCKVSCGSSTCHHFYYLFYGIVFVVYKHMMNRCLHACTFTHIFQTNRTILQTPYSTLVILTSTIYLGNGAVMRPCRAALLFLMAIWGSTEWCTIIFHPTSVKRNTLGDLSQLIFLLKHRADCFSFYLKFSLAPHYSQNTISKAMVLTSEVFTAWPSFPLNLISSHLSPGACDPPPHTPWKSSVPMESLRQSHCLKSI